MRVTGLVVGRAMAVFALSVLLTGGIAALLLLPHGFALTDIHTWSNTVIPTAAVIAAASVLGRHLFFGGAPNALSAVTAAAAGAFFAGVMVGVALYPVSLTASRAAAPAAAALVLVGVATWIRTRTAPTVVGLAVGAGLGVVEILAQRAPAPSTRPAGGALAEVHGPAIGDEALTGQIVVACGKGTIRMNPLLTFQSRSPDRTWVLFARPEDLGPRRSLTHFAKTPNGFRASYTDDGLSTLVASKDKAGALEVEAVSRLSGDVYAHLDAWTVLHVAEGARLSFGPTGDARFAVEPADYPRGRPAQLAYLGEDLTFRVVRARDAEKGPYTELANGKLTRDETLTLEVRPREESDKDKGCRLLFKDWAAQVSTDASPTAGWGVPQNSIQFFSRGGEAVVILTLAETGPGRGWDSVGHAAGTYRNRIRVEAIR